MGILRWAGQKLGLVPKKVVQPQGETDEMRRIRISQERIKERAQYMTPLSFGRDTRAGHTTAKTNASESTRAVPLDDEQRGAESGIMTDKQRKVNDEMAREAEKFFQKKLKERGGGGGEKGG